MHCQLSFSDLIIVITFDEKCSSETLKPLMAPSIFFPNILSILFSSTLNHCYALNKYGNKIFRSESAASTVMNRPYFRTCTWNVHPFISLIVSGSNLQQVTGYVPELWRILAVPACKCVYCLEKVTTASFQNLSNSSTAIQGVSELHGINSGMRSPCANNKRFLC